MEIKENKRQFKVFADMNLEIFGFKKIVRKNHIGVIKKMYDGNFGFNPFYGYIISAKELQEITNKLKELNK